MANDLQAEDRRGGHIDIRWSSIVERDAEHLTDVFGEHIEGLAGRVEPAVPDITRPADIDDAGRRSIRVDESEIVRGLVRAASRRVESYGAGKSGDDRVA